MNNIKDQDTTAESLPAEEHETSEPEKMSRRKALAILGKHAVYTTPAVLTIMSLSPKNAQAFSF